MEQATKSLILPFVQGSLAMPERAFLIRADTSSAFDEDWRSMLKCEQTFKPAFDRLQRAGFDVVRRLEGRFAIGLCLLTKHKDENLANLARAWSLLDPGGTLVCAGAKNEGAASVESRAKAVFGLRGQQSKYHCRVFWTKATAEAPPPTDWIDLDRLALNVCSTYWTRPGIFSASRVDAGSRLLVEHLPERMPGAVADLGAGWGYLSSHLLARHSEISRLDLYEAEWLALEAARANLESAPAASRAQFFWSDVTEELPNAQAYDWIVMNPPFHEGRSADLSLGRAFIASAAKALRPGGRMLMVANRHLPYEQDLKHSFGTVEELATTNGFKIIRTRR